MADALAQLPCLLPGTNQWLVLKLVEGSSGIFAFTFDVQADPTTYSSGGTVTAGANIVGSVLPVASGIIDATYDTDRYIWTAPVPCQLILVQFTQSAIENTSATTTLMPQKVPSGTAIAAAGAKDLLGAAVNLKTGVVADTTLTPALSATTADLQFAVGNNLGLNFTNALTEYVGCVSFLFKMIT